jgi:hypothetical protein
MDHDDLDLSILKAASSSSAQARDSLGSMTALSSATVSPRCRHLIDTEARISLLIVCQAPQKE